MLIYWFTSRDLIESFIESSSCRGKHRCDNR